jgi:diguanylate cyclase (GGDEF)-like protein/PAS domain S-box-containing protein
MCQGKSLQNQFLSDTIQPIVPKAEILMFEKPNLERGGFPEQTAVGIVHATPEGHILRSNERFAEIIGYSPDEVAGLTFQQITTPEDVISCAAAFRGLWNRSSDAVSLEVRCFRKDGNRTWLKLTASLQYDAQGQPSHLLALIEDINDRKAAEVRLAMTAEALQTREQGYRYALQTCPQAVLIARLADGKIVDANPEFLELTGFQHEEVIGRTSLELDLWASEGDRKRLAEALDQSEGCRDVEVRLKRKDGEIFWGELSASFTEIEGEACVLCFIRDISAAKAEEDEIKNLAFYDTLTGLPNRRLLWERLRQALIVSVRNRCKHALLFIDLDNFKSLNDALGHHIGDLMLQETARRITGCVREADTVARFGGDEFVVILEDLGPIPEIAATRAKAVGEKILAAIGEAYVLEGRECHSSSSMGITIFGNNGETGNEVLQQADMSMYQAKATGRNSMLFFAPALQASVNARAEMEADLRQAIKTNQFALYYQPQLDRGLFTGAEALVRWNHPKRGLVPPHEFVPLAEETGLILPLGSWVLETACAQIAAWTNRREGAHLEVAVNISAREFRQPKFVEQVLTTLHQAGANPKNLKLELNQSVLAGNIEDIIAKMTELKSHGVRFSLDDFGTGYSSMAYLKRLPFDQLKIDRSFVGEIPVDPISGAVAQAIISFSKALGLSVIAEGVETEEQRTFLAGLGCHSFQGYLFCHPLPLGEF